MRNPMRGSPPLIVTAVFQCVSYFPEVQTAHTVHPLWLTWWLSSAHTFKFSSSQPFGHISCVIPSSSVSVTFYYPLYEVGKTSTVSDFQMVSCMEYCAHIPLTTKLVEWLPSWVIRRLTYSSEVVIKFKYRWHFLLQVCIFLIIFKEASWRELYNLVLIMVNTDRDSVQLVHFQVIHSN